MDQTNELWYVSEDSNQMAGRAATLITHTSSRRLIPVGHGRASNSRALGLAAHTMWDQAPRGGLGRARCANVIFNSFSPRLERP